MLDDACARVLSTAQTCLFIVALALNMGQATRACTSTIAFTNRSPTRSPLGRPKAGLPAPASSLLLYAFADAPDFPHLHVQYDTDVTTWSPQGRLFQVEYAMEAVKQGSAAAGLTVSAAARMQPALCGWLPIAE